MKDKQINRYIAVAIFIGFMLYGGLMISHAQDYEQDDGRTYKTVNQGSINEIGYGYGSDGTGSPSNADATGFYRFEVPVDAISDINYTDDGFWVELGNLATGTDISTAAGDGLVWDAVDLDIDVNPGTGITIGGDAVIFSGTYTTVSSNDGATNVTGAELESLSDGSDANAFHTHTDVSVTITLDDAYDAGDTIDYTADTGPVVLNFPDGGTTDSIVDATIPNTYEIRNQWIQTNETDILNVSTLYYSETDDVTPQDNHLMGILSTDSGTNKYLRWLISSLGEFQGETFTVRNYPTNANPIHIIDQNGAVFNQQGTAIDFRVESDSHTNAIFLDASEDIISVVGNEFYIGDVDTNTPIQIADGSANYFGLVIPPLAADYQITVPDVKATTNQILSAVSIASDNVSLGWIELTGLNINNKAITVETPAADEDITLWYTDYALTITQLAGVVRGLGAGVIYTIRHHTDRSNAGNEVITGGASITSLTVGDIESSFNDATVPADSWIWLETTASSTTPEEMAVTLLYTID